MNWLRLGYIGTLCSSTLCTLLVGCSDDASLGRDGASSSGSSASTAGGTVNTGAGTGNPVGSAGGPSAGTTSTATAGGPEMSGGAPSSGGAASSGAGPQAGDGSSGGEPSFDDSPVNLANALTEPTTPGTGQCAASTLAAVLDAIAQEWPALADITRLYTPDSAGDGNQIYAFAKPDGFRIVVTRGSGDCPAGCIDHEYWYFETTTDCQVVQRGHYARVFNSSGNCYGITGAPLWGLPPATNATQCPAIDLSALNTNCVNDACPSGLTPVKFYGAAGTAGPQFCWCTIPCADASVVCPTGTTCTQISDGPGKVCYKP